MNRRVDLWVELVPVYSRWFAEVQGMRIGRIFKRFPKEPTRQMVQVTISVDDDVLMPRIFATIERGEE